MARLNNAQSKVAPLQQARQGWHWNQAGRVALSALLVLGMAGNAAAPCSIPPFRRNT
jgi:hypothetical protein